MENLRIRVSRKNMFARLIWEEEGHYCEIVVPIKEYHFFPKQGVEK